MIYYKVRRDHIGNLLIKPIAKKYKYLDIFLQTQGDIEAFLDGLSKYNKEALNQGYTVRVKLSDEYLTIMENIYEYENLDYLKSKLGLSKSLSKTQGSLAWSILKEE